MLAHACLFNLFIGGMHSRRDRTYLFLSVLGFPLPADAWERRRRGIGCFCCTVSHGFFMNFYTCRPLYFSPPPLLEVSFVDAEICVCSVVLEPWVIAFLVVCHYRDFCSQCVGVQRKKKSKHENSYPPYCGRSSREEVSPGGVIWMNCCLQGNGRGT